MTITISSLLFIIPVYFLFCIIRKEFRLYVLSTASLLYILMLDLHAGIAVFLTAFTAWLLGSMIGYLHDRGHIAAERITAALSVTACVCALACLKYMPVLRMTAAGGGSIADRLIMPIGFSFYVFQTISYYLDICKGSVEAEHNPFRLFLYLAWFPKFISGPIERSAEFRNEINRCGSVKLIDMGRWCHVICFMVTGVFMKIVIADRLGICVDQIFARNAEFSSLWLMLGSLFYTLQIYTDFAGYSLFAIGVSALFGIRLSDNFMMPYLSHNITEFWRRWHMTLSSWLRDYVYIPLGGSRKGKIRKILNTMIVFLLCGMWHGAGLTFIIWGLLHGLYSTVDSIARDKGLKQIRNGPVGCVLTFIAVSFAWIFFRADSMEQAGSYLQGIFKAGLQLRDFAAQKEMIGLSPQDTVVLILALLFLFAADRIAEKTKQPFPEFLTGIRQAPRWLILVLMMFVIIVFGAYGPKLDTGLIYMQF